MSMVSQCPLLHDGRCSGVMHNAGVETPDDVSKDIQKILDMTKFKGQGAAATVLRITSKGIVSTLATGAAGQRRVGYTTPVQHSDLFDVASCGKSFTSALWAMLVTQEYADWSDTIADILSYSDVTVPKLHPQYAKATLSQLLSHRAGFTDNTDTDAMPTTLSDKLKPASPLTPTEQRRLYSFYVLSQKPTQGLGVFLYSNEGYNVASWLAEVVAGDSFENLIRTNFFKPLGFTKAGFGLPYKFPLGNKPPAYPIGHDCDNKNGLTTSEYDWEAYAAFGLGSGGLYMTITDLANWVAYHIKGSKGLLPANSLISRANFLAVHRPWVAPDADNDGNYAKGWYNDNLPFAAIYHDGAYAGFRTYMVGVTQPDAKGNMLAVTTTTNVLSDVDGKCSDAVDNILTLLSDNMIDKYMPGIRSERKRSKRLARRLVSSV